VNDNVTFPATDGIKGLAKQEKIQGTGNGSVGAMNTPQAGAGVSTPPSAP